MQTGVEEAAVALPTTGVWGIDSGHSTAVFAIRHHGISLFRGMFMNLQGSYDGDARKLVGSAAVSEIAVALPPLRARLMEPGYFDADNHPDVSFESTSIVDQGLRGLVVEGDLTLRGVTRPIKADAVSRGPVGVVYPHGEFPHFGIDLATVIDRRDFGMDSLNPLPNGISNIGWDVEIAVSIEITQA